MQAGDTVTMLDRAGFRPCLTLLVVAVDRAGVPTCVRTGRADCSSCGEHFHWLQFPVDNGQLVAHCSDCGSGQLVDCRHPEPKPSWWARFRAWLGI